METTKTNPNPVEMSTAELKALLATKEKAERAAQMKRKREYIGTRDAFLKRVISEMSDISFQLKELKQFSVKKGNELHDLLYEVYEKEPKDLKSFSLDSECGTYRVTIDSAERQAMDETADVAIGAIKDILRNKFASRNKTMYNIIDGILIKNNKGDYDERLIAKLRKFETDINDVEFSKELDNLSRAFYTYDTSIYVRGYVKNSETNKWEAIPMQFSSL